MNNFGQVQQVIDNDNPLVVYLSQENGLLATPDSYTMHQPLLVLSGQFLESFCLLSSPTTSISRITEDVVTQPNDTFRVHQSDLESHESANTTGKKFQCAMCRKAFTRKYDCDNHKRRIHDGLKPHHCDICGRAFFKNSEMVVRNLHIFFNRMGRHINYSFIGAP
jgi:hypothetical protein